MNAFEKLLKGVNNPDSDNYPQRRSTDIPDLHKNPVNP